jgi:hypothetical protein
MPNKNALIVKTVFALAQGCGGTEITEEAADWFHGRYYEWIDKPKKDPRANGQSPQEAWDKEGKAFLGHFRRIGENAAGASKGEVIERETLERHARDYEKSLDCPWCPDRE